MSPRPARKGGQIVTIQAAPVLGCARRGALAACPGPAAYGSCYEPAPMPASPLDGMLAGNRIPAKIRGPGMSEPGQGAPERPGPGSLFVVERRRPKIDDRTLMVLQSALTSTAAWDWPATR